MGAAVAYSLQLVVVQEGQQKTCLLESLQALLCLQQLDQRVSTEPATWLQLLGIVAGILGETDSLGAAKGAFLKTCLAYLQPQLTSPGESAAGF